MKKILIIMVMIVASIALAKADCKEPDGQPVVMEPVRTMR